MGWLFMLRCFLLELLVGKGKVFGTIFFLITKQNDNNVNIKLWLHWAKPKVYPLDTSRLFDLCSQ